MDRPEILDVIPKESWTFTASIDVERPTVVVLNNISQHKVAFKVKTTSPALFTVLPYMGIIEKDGSQHVNIFMHSDVQALVSQHGHRFRIQAVEMGIDKPLKELFKSANKRDMWKLTVPVLIVPAFEDGAERQTEREDLNALTNGLPKEDADVVNSRRYQKIAKHLLSLQNEAANMEAYGEIDSETGLEGTRVRSLPFISTVVFLAIFIVFIGIVIVKALN